MMAGERISHQEPETSDRLVSLLTTTKHMAGGRIPQRGPDLNKNALPPRAPAELGERRKIPRHEPDVSETAGSLLIIVEEREDVRRAGPPPRLRGEDMRHGPKDFNVGSEIPTSGGSMSPWLALDTVKKKENVTRTSKTFKPGPEERTKSRRPGYPMLITDVAVEMFQPTCFERGYPGTEKPSKGYK
jgi:hypothetical protein